MTDVSKGQKAWAAAWVECWAKLQEIETAATATITGKEGRQGYSYKYATLGDTLTAVRPILHAHGFAIFQNVTNNDAGAVEVTTSVLHKDGWDQLSGPVVVPASDDPKKVGAAVTYARRYGLAAALGIATDEDKDAPPQEGEVASGPEDGRLAAQISDHLCPACLRAGDEVPVIDNLKVHLNPAEGRKAQPVWKCSKERDCAEDSQYGWGSYDKGFFEDQETSNADELTVSHQEMQEIFKITDTPKAAVIKWLNIQFRNDPDEAGLFWTAVVERDPKIEGMMDLLTEEQALAIEGVMRNVLDEWGA